VEFSHRLRPPDALFARTESCAEAVLAEDVLRTVRVFAVEALAEKVAAVPVITPVKVAAPLVRLETVVPSNDVDPFAMINPPEPVIPPLNVPVVEVNARVVVAPEETVNPFAAVIPFAAVRSWLNRPVVDVNPCVATEPLKEAPAPLKRKRSVPSVPKEMTPFKSGSVWAPDMSMKDCCPACVPPPAPSLKKPESSVVLNALTSPADGAVSKAGRVAGPGDSRETPPFNVLRLLTLRDSMLMSFAVNGPSASMRSLNVVHPSTVSAALPFACASMSTGWTKRTMGMLLF